MQQFTNDGKLNYAIPPFKFCNQQKNISVYLLIFPARCDSCARWNKPAFDGLENGPMFSTPSAIVE